MNRETAKLEKRLEWLVSLGWRQITEKVFSKEEVDEWRDYLATRGNQCKVIGNEKSDGYYLIARRTQPRGEE